MVRKECPKTTLKDKESDSTIFQPDFRPTKTDAASSKSYLLPLDIVLGLLFQDTDSFQDIGNVINAPLLDIEAFGGYIQVDHAVRGRLQKSHELLGEQTQRGIVPRPFYGFACNTTPVRSRYCALSPTSWLRSKTRGSFNSAKNHKRQRRKRQSVTAKREKSQTPKFV